MNAQIANQNNAIANLTSQFSNLTAQVNLTTANIVTVLEVNDGPISYWNFVVVYWTCNYLHIAGSASNISNGTAYNAGLHVIAYNATGTLEINMTRPFSSFGYYGTDDKTKTYASTIAHGQTVFTGTNSSLQIPRLYGGQNVTIGISIFHEGTVSNWTLTPVWTNSP